MHFNDHKKSPKNDSETILAAKIPHGNKLVSPNRIVQAEIIIIPLFNTSDINKYQTVHTTGLRSSGLMIGQAKHNWTLYNWYSCGTVWYILISEVSINGIIVMLHATWITWCCINIISGWNSMLCLPKTTTSNDIRHFLRKG